MLHARNHLNVVDRSLSSKLDLNLKREETQWIENLTGVGFKVAIKVAIGNPFSCPLCIKLEMCCNYGNEFVENNQLSMPAKINPKEI